MTVHVKDLLLLETTSSTTYSEIAIGNFVPQKSRKKFSSLAHDQGHEQLNAMLKGDGGAIDLTENEAALKTVIQIPFSVMKIMHSLHLWLQTMPCVRLLNKTRWDAWRPWYLNQMLFPVLTSKLLMELL